MATSFALDDRTSTKPSATITSRAARAAAKPSVKWERQYARALVVSDSILIALALIATVLVVPHPATVSVEVIAASAEVSVWVVVAVIAIAIGTLLSLSGSRTSRVVGVGSQEYRAVVRSCFLAITSVALFAYVFRVSGLPFILAAGLAATVGVLLLSRWVARRWLVAQRKQGRMANRVLLVGSEESVASTARDLQRNPAAGLYVVGGCTPTGRIADYIPGTEIAVSGSVSNVMDALRRVSADTVLITSSNELSADTVRTLSWQLEPGQQHLIVAPSLTDIGGPRLHTRPVSGLPLVHVETPRYRGGKLHAKRVFDVLAAGALILLLAPVLVAVMVAVQMSSPGGIFFRQERIGLGGERFSMLKFRSMYVDAEERLAELAQADRDSGNDVMFKMKDDPRVTSIGRILRRFSLDELPQLFNVVRGDMALVGPRPPLDREVRQYADSVHRRFLVKPGITGLWQVSGRSDLDWDATVRLDLFYVENWTLTGDLVILLKTVRAVLRSDGAY
ncbi:sugar transferase [Microbacterium sp. BK668]|uniref:sugar transferase n=1 Tax=Microbacterium sp. BK668 TaxID=2512118 RepID=UPI001061ABF9|nr:sugar transferase [Microbacterium sp. BK668]TDN90540.1 Undecaprenyl-phosphate galactose phosphotransferase WbaP/exopolysaccharide biosynthesis polyprenyl glycosylphosphotransferase [Microbacterium sp. BK668]